MPNPRVLIIDDDPMVTKLLEEHLSNEGYDVTAVHMAEEGFKLATESPPDLIFLDVMLPDATGFQTVARFRKHAATSIIPIIMMSGTARNANQLDIAKSMGATDYVLKPFDVIKVGEQVRQLIKNKPVAKNQPAPEPEFAPEPAPTPEPRKIHQVEALPPAPLTPAFSSGIELISMHELPAREAPLREPQAWTLPDHATVESAPLPAPEEPKISPIEIQNEIPLEPLPAFTLPALDIPIPQETPPAQRRSWVWIAAPGLFAIHMALTIFGAEKDAIQAASYTAGGWALLLGCLVAACGLLQISIDAREALIIEGWAAIPILLRALMVVVGFAWPLPKLPAVALWMRPLDLFEISALLIFGISVRKLPGSSLIKSVIASVLIALAWCLTARGYFHPF